MSDSEDSDLEQLKCDDIRGGAKLIYEKDSPYVALQPPDTIYKRWTGISIRDKKKAAEFMNLTAFWYHIVLVRQECHRTTRWAVQVGFIDSNVNNDLSLKRLRRIEILEAILRALEKGSLRDDQTRQMIWISNQFILHVPKVLDDALLWLERTGEPHIRQHVEELGHLGIMYNALQLIFSEYAHYILAMGADYKKMMKELGRGPSQWSIEKSEERKNKGNHHFQEKDYEAAVKCYTKAIKYHPENHIIYGNRALCYMRSEKYLKAVGDGKRATLIKPGWAKGHYRFCEALFSLGKHREALNRNILAQGLCKDDAEGMRDLQQQYAKFSIEMKEIKDKQKAQIKKTSSKSATRTDLEEGPSQGSKPSIKADPLSTTTAPQQKDLEGESETTGKQEGETHSSDITKGPKSKSDLGDKKSHKQENSASEKQKSKGRSQLPKEKEVPNSSKESEYAALMSAVHDAHTALTDQRCRNAEKAFSLALSILEKNKPKELGVSVLDQILLIYGRASALIEIGQPEELAEAERELEKIKSHEERTFQCLVYFAIGKVYLKWNRFSNALEQFSCSMQMVKNQITPGKLCWPTTKDIVKETQLDYFKAILETSIEMCKFPLKPDAICRHLDRSGHSKVEIFFTDPDFKGFIRIVCCQNCIVEYHMSCWKTLKSVSFSDRNEKDFIQDMCFTPDCGGVICNIQIYGSTGLLKCKFEAPATKPAGLVKVKVNQKCTSLKKLMSKEERKWRKKQHREVNSQIKQDLNGRQSLEKNDHTVAESEDKASSPALLLYGDRILLQISENRALFQDENEHNVAPLLKSLKPWMDLDHLKGNKLPPGAGDRLQPETLWEAVELVLERNNRVWARVFLQYISENWITSTKLHDWAHQLDKAGLSAAGAFIERYAEHLEQLDLAPLLLFPPLQDMLIKKFGTMPEFFSHTGLTVTEYLKQAPSQEMRLFIWTMEEHRDQYASFHSVLDEYFEVMDGLCVVIRKSDNENPYNSPIKNKNRQQKRKRKIKEPKNIIYVGVRSTREDEEDIFDEEDSLMILDHNDPFSVPSRLRDRVAEFEVQYNNGNHSTQKHNNPDPTKESLYDYFAQILEEHGPLGAQDPLLVGQLDNFPAVAWQKIQEAGGLRPFLLESLRFTMNDNLIGLMKHTMSLLNSGDGNAGRQGLDDLDCTMDNMDKKRLNLNPSAVEFLPSRGGFGLDDFGETVSFDEGITAPVRHEPVYYAYGLDPNFHHPPQPASFFSGLGGAFGIPRGDEAMLHDVTSYTDETFNNLDMTVSKRHEHGVLETDVSIGTSGKLPVQSTAIQTTCDLKSDVAVNTEPYEPFEINNGDRSRKEKDNTEFMKRIHQMKEDYGSVKQTRQDEISALNEELDNINQSLQITNKELALFQQKLEEEVKKDQQEKRDNQETLKTMKAEVKELMESQESLTKTIKEKNKEYKVQLNAFLELSNQSAAEKMSLEDEIKRCRDLCSDAGRRSQTSELFIMENRQGQRLHCLYRSLTDARAILAKLQEAAPRYPPHILQSVVEAWSACMRESEEKISATEVQYREQIELVKRGTTMSTLPPIVTHPAPQPPPIPTRNASSLNLPLPLLPGQPALRLPHPALPFIPPFVPMPPFPVRPPPGLGLPVPRTPAGSLPGTGPGLDRQAGQFLYPTQQPLHQQLPLQLPPHPSYGGPVPVKGLMYPHHGAPSPPAVQALVPSEPLLGQAGALAKANASSQSGVAQRAAQPPHQSQANQQNPGPRHPTPHPLSVFDKIVDRLMTMFPHYSRPMLMKFIQDMRAANGGALNSLSYQEVINRVAQLILDHQENNKELMAGGRGDHLVGQAQRCGTPPRSDSPASVRSAGTPPPAHVWKSVGTHGRPQSRALNMEDPCIICHEDMSQEDMCVLECRHSFHRECIKSWLKEQSTCPTCREHALLPEDFPVLPGRNRRGHTPAAFS